jgi:Zinc binding domain
MSDCCSSSCNLDTPPKKYRCPVNGKKYMQVSAKTIMHHIKKPWAWEEKQQAYYFCEDPACEVVYFGQDNSVIKKSALRTIVGIKEKSQSKLLCYCFGISFEEAAKKSEIKQLVIEKTKNNLCACDTRNPSGRCCLKDFPK